MNGLSLKISDYLGNSIGSEILRDLPPVLRARDFHLYLDGGRRLCDLWQTGGRAILGAKPNRVVTELKNSSERGLFAPLPHPTENRLLKALAKLFALNEGGHEYSFRLYDNKLSLMKALENAGLLSNEIIDPVFSVPENSDIRNADASNANALNTNGKTQVTLWRPFLRNEKPAPVYLPILPWAFSPYVLALDINANEKKAEKPFIDRFAMGDLIAPVILAPAARAIHDLLALGENGGRPRYLRIEKTLAKSNKWYRRGIYLAPNPAADDKLFAQWPYLWKHFLEQGFLLPPSPFEPLILPGMLSPGEEAKLAALLGE